MGDIRNLIKLFQGDYVTVQNIAEKTFYTEAEVQKRFDHLEENGYIEDVGSGRYVPKEGLTVKDLRNEFFKEFENL